MTLFVRFTLCVLLAGTLKTPASEGSAQVRLIRTPDGGIQPQAATDAKGVVHLIYFKGKPQAGDVFYVRREPGQATFSPPIRVNGRTGSVIAIGTIRGAQLAIGRKGRVHVAWMGGDGAARAIVNGREVTPMLYTRLNDAGTKFEPERNVMTWAAGLDGGGSVAADSGGNVYVAWHASPSGNEKGEVGRAVFVARSTDDGATFQREERANSKPTGACGCCGMKTYADSRGLVYVLYRAANGISRDMTLLVSHDHGLSFELSTVNKWMINGCPMSSCSFAEAGAGVVAATEREGHVGFNLIDPETLTISSAAWSAAGEKCRHPAVAVNSQGDVLLAWTEGTAWEKGGALAWQLFDKNGKATAEKGRTDGVPVWSLPAAFAGTDRQFEIIY